VDRIERIESRTEGPGWVLPVAAGRRAERRDDRDRRERDERRPPRRRPPGTADGAPNADGHVDVSA
jgi:hypothetical protein